MIWFGACPPALQTISHCRQERPAEAVRSDCPPPGLFGLRPVEVLVEEVKGANAVDGMAAVEELDGSLVANAQVVVEPPHFAVFKRDPFVQPNRVAVAA